MPLDSKHPLYTEFLEDWRTMDHVVRGERVVKREGVRYLPATSGMIADGFPAPESVGWKMYEAYRARAIFHGFTGEAVKALVGIMHHKPPTIELPRALEPMRTRGTVLGESLEMLLRKINRAQLTQGRFGMLLDLPNAPTIGEVLPYIATYRATTIINWDNGRREEPVVQHLNLVVLDETEFERQRDFEWEAQEKFRVLVLGDPVANEPEGEAVYRQGVFRERDANFSESNLVTPSLRGRTLNFIPFVFVNACDIVPDPDDPPLMSLAKLDLAIYRGEADYRQSLFMQGQDTLVVIGDRPGEDGNPKTYRTGAGAVIALPAGQGVDAKFIGVEADGLAEQREALDSDKKDAATLAGQLMDATARGVESGEALQIRVSARTATLNDIALTGAFALETILKMAATWVGANPDEVRVRPNLDFADEMLEGKTLVEYMEAKALGAPISLQSVHRLMQDRGATKLSYEDELALIEQEEPLTEPTGPEDDRGVE